MPVFEKKHQYPGKLFIVDGIDGRTHHLTFADIEATTDCRPGSIVELRRFELIDYIRDIVDIFVQVGRYEGVRLITEIEFSGSLKTSLEIVSNRTETTPIRTAN